MEELQLAEVIEELKGPLEGLYGSDARDMVDMLGVSVESLLGGVDVFKLVSDCGFCKSAELLEDLNPINHLTNAEIWELVLGDGSSRSVDEFVDEDSAISFLLREYASEVTEELWEQYFAEIWDDIKEALKGYGDADLAELYNEYFPGVGLTFDDEEGVFKKEFFVPAEIS